MVNVEKLDKSLAEHPFFKDLDERAQKILAGCARHEHFDAGDYIAHEGKPAERFYLIRTGAVALEFHVPGRGREVLDVLHDGEVFGWSWMVPPHEWVFDIRAEEHTSAISLDGACLRKKMAKDNELGCELYNHFITIMAQRFKRVQQKLKDMYGKG